jgi:hypothetical protein
MTKPINIAAGIINAVNDVTKQWAKQRKAEERSRSAEWNRWDRLVRSDRITIKQAAWEVMEEAYNRVSDDGRLPARPRQIMYVARPRILAITGNDVLNDAYFTQKLLPDYINHYQCDDWNIVWDARGHFTEPHTGVQFDLGTLEIREYLGLRPKRGDAITVDRDVLYPTWGPERRYDTVLFIEKEGFDPLFAAVQLAERYDLAIASTKGMSVTALRELLDALVDRGVRRVLVLRDFDISGFSIFGTLGTSNRRYQFSNQVNVIDLGLRLDDVNKMGLESEPAITDKSWDKVSTTLRRHGANRQEIDFLQDRRVELNAMTSPQLIEFVEGKLAEHGVTKLIPDEATLQIHARRLIEQKLAAAEVEKIKAKLMQEAAQVPLPADLYRKVEQRLAAEQKLSWDQALADVLAGGRPRIGRPTR